MRFGILGAVEAFTAQGESLPVGGPRQRALLALLLLDAGRVVTVERLLGGLYGDEPPSGATSALQSQVSRLRRSFPIEFHPGGYRIAVDPQYVDVHQFERLAKEGAATKDPATLREALNLWRGPVTANEAAAARLEELKLATTEDLFDAQLKLGEHNAVIPEIRAVIERNPLRERLRGQLMLALHAAGRQAEALTEFENTRRTLAEELGADPSAELSAIHLAVLKGEHRPSANVPAQLTSFVGRTTELSRIAGLLSAARLVTITGPGGAGKTRLAIEIAAQQTRETCFVDLTTHGTDIPQAILAATGVRDAGLFTSSGQDPVNRVIAAFENRHILLIMDNCEHVIADAATITHRLLNACPDLRILATSREALGITGEHLCPLPTLPANVAMRLFADRAAAVSPDFRITEENAETVEQICTSLDGMPLAIELAAARLRAMALDDIADRLNDRFSLLSRGDRTAAPRHRTLRAAVEWSWDLLEPNEQLLATRLTVFTGGATLSAAEQVCQVPETAELLAGLVDKSLVENAGGRYRMLETIRAFCAEHRTDSRDALHAKYFYDLAETANTHLRRAEQLEWLNRLDADNGNLQAALRWAVANDTTLALRMFGAFSLYWYLRGLRSQAAPLAMELLGRIGTHPPEELDEEYVACVLQAAWGQLGAPEWQDHLKHAEEFMTTPRGPLRRPHSAFLWATATGPPKGEPVRPLLDQDLWAESFAALGAALLHIFDGEISAGEGKLHRALAGFRELGDRFGIVLALDAIANIAGGRGDRQGFVDAVTEAMEVVSQLGSIDDMTSLLCRRAENLARHGELDDARADFEQALTLARRNGTPDHLAWAYSGLGEIARFQGDLAEARRLQELALTKCSAGPFGIREYRARALIALARLDELNGDFAAARSRYDEAISAAMANRALPFVALAAAGLAGLAVRSGDGWLAALLLGAGTAIQGMPLAGDPEIARVAAEAKALTSGDEFAEAFARGAGMAQEEALTLVGARRSALGA
ncbi:tetratricopeptide repeat protein [Kibdelosporangium philippinense]|uniref:Tetratricopeptide repeat protein n=1 Tax=Kibdelosporangium philippinense TaxID=211113 RepID=A0ABS8Z6L1_9PSEU|nr:BTAD domain-containing putative transcriptional regulator [Kibdelosporangium philippinense]MCE7003516.1 tetratricopeptide repeat protein [Kibdelosporangium philippinense]